MVVARSAKACKPSISPCTVFKEALSNIFATSSLFCGPAPTEEHENSLPGDNAGRGAVIEIAKVCSIAESLDAMRVKRPGRSSWPLPDRNLESDGAVPKSRSSVAGNEDDCVTTCGPDDNAGAGSAADAGSGIARPNGNFSVGAGVCSSAGVNANAGANADVGAGVCVCACVGAGEGAGAGTGMGMGEGESASAGEGSSAGEGASEGESAGAGVGTGVGTVSRAGVVVDVGSGSGSRSGLGLN